MSTETRNRIVEVALTLLLSAVAACCTCMGWSYSRGEKDASFLTKLEAGATYVHQDVAAVRDHSIDQRLDRIEGGIDKISEKLGIPK